MFRDVKLHSVVLVFMLLISSQSYTQNYGIGLNATGGMNLSHGIPGIGLGISAQYESADGYMKYRIGWRFYYSELFKFEYLSHTYIAEIVEASILYTFFDGVARPFVGVGLGYTDFNIDAPGNAKFEGNKQIRTTNDKITKSFTLLWGISIGKRGGFEVNIESGYRLIPLKFTVELIEYQTETIILRKNLILRDVLVNIGFIVNF
ncbi:MAG: hypothetical protein SCALA702_37760 [Melioribacteraceae bacterium]|nr:MAG: hypothetical protein SCALA702_37760 [Melioribacteraceae bacterium]